MDRKRRITISDLIDRNWKPDRVKGGKISITELIESERLVCDNPQCRKLINDRIVAFSPDYDEIYHPRECSEMAIAIKAFNSGKMIFGSIEYIPRNLVYSVRLNYKN